MSQLVRKFFLPVICPAAIVSTIQQALLVVLPLYVLSIGGTLAESAMIIGFKGIGMMLGDLPAGLLLARFGDKRLMLGAAVTSSLSLALMALFPTLGVLTAAALLLGFAHGSWLVGRISYVSDAAAPNERGRVMSLSAGTIRLGNVVGPLLAGFMIAAQGYQVTLAVFTLSSLLVVLFVALWVVYSKPHGEDSHHVAALQDAVVDNRKVLLTAGVASLALMLVRASRALLLPLTGAALLLDETSIGMVISIGAVVDTLLFYPAGTMMDRIGRKPMFIASLTLLGLSISLLPMAEGLWSLILIASLMGLGNGVSAGVIMTVGSDLAPRLNRGGFIGIWRLLSDVGSTSGPLLIGLMVKLSGLAMASYSIGLLGLLGGAFVVKAMRETHRKDDRVEVDRKG
ncbi:MFS transporter [Amphritea opalescens]|uniref:MFS transporter n=1 Tax=Amphritea opalescens TaxID=2490544 RepID=UPI0013DF96A4|nr:MFS transporter [Amphritea opalescens]